MITDEKRRRVVHTLRQLDNAVDDEPMDRTIAHDATILNMIRDATFGLDGSIFQRLADLIDRPTCHLEITAVETHGNTEVRIYECSECGRSCEEIYGKYERCPHCGAVVEDGTAH